MTIKHKVLNKHRFYANAHSKDKCTSSACKLHIFTCRWIKEQDLVRKVTDNVFEVWKESGVFFKINKIGDYFITAAHCVAKENTNQFVDDYDIAIYNTVTGEEGNDAWINFKNILKNSKFHNQIYQVNGCGEKFKPGDSGLLCEISKSKKIMECELLESGSENSGFLLVSGGTALTVFNGLLPKEDKYGSTGSVVNGVWFPRDAREMVFSGEAGCTKEMFGVKWVEFEEYSKITSLIKHPYHILNEEEKKIANDLHQFPDLVTEKLYDIKEIKRVKIPKKDVTECHEYILNKKIFSYHETENRLIFAILPAFETNGESFKSGTPVFDAETNNLVSCITKYNDNTYAVSGIGWESGQIVNDDNWIGVQCHLVGRGESVYGNYYGPYSEVKKMAAAKAVERFGVKTGVGIYLQEKMVQVVSYDENGKERWRIRLFHENCKIADSTT